MRQSKNIMGLIMFAHFIFIFSSCKKKNENINLRVTEYKTNAPLAGVSIAFVKSGDFDLSCLCFLPEIFFSATTDANGICTATQENFNKAALGIAVAKDHYWPVTFFAPQTKYELDPVASVTVHLHNVKSYPGNSLMIVSCAGERATSTGSGTPEFSLPADSTIVFDAFGGQSNTIWWRVYTSAFTPLDSGFQKIDVARTGTTQIEFQY